MAKILDFFKSKAGKHDAQASAKREATYLQDNQLLEQRTRAQANASVLQNFQRSAAADSIDGNAMDSADELKLGSEGAIGVAPVVMNYFAGQRFIGYYSCALLAQNAMISKCCTIPAVDSIRNGWSVEFNGEHDVAVEVLDKIKELDKKFNINKNLVEFSKFNKVFGIRVALFDVECENPDEFYANPFNIDGVGEGCYKGISQIDPYWMTPMLSAEGATDPSSRFFYEPEYWLIQGRKIHRSHLVIARGDEVADILKPTYFYGGISLVQKIYQRVYAAERTANEAPLLAQTKRLNVRKTDMAVVNQNPEKFYQNLEKQALLRDNYGVLVVDIDEDVQALETNLADVDEVTMGQYQLLAGIADIPITKLLGTQMRGFSSGEHDFEVYYHTLETEQNYILTPLLDRHYQLLMKSEIEPRYGFNENATVKWEKPYTLSQREQAELQNMKANTDAVLANIGAIDGEAIQARIMADPQSDYMGATIKLDEPIDNELDDPYVAGGATTPLKSLKAGIKGDSGKKDYYTPQSF